MYKATKFQLETKKKSYQCFIFRIIVRYTCKGENTYKLLLTFQSIQLPIGKVKIKEIIDNIMMVKWEK